MECADDRISTAEGRECTNDISLDREMGVVNAAGERRDSLFYAENPRKILYTG